MFVKSKGPSEASAKFRTVHLHLTEKNAREGGHAGNKISTTKYTMFNFFFKNIIQEQFSRVANIYFLVIAILSATAISPLHPATSILPLVFVLSVTAAKEAAEDRRRARQDAEINSRKVTVLRNGKDTRISWSSLRTGEIVKVQNKEFLPADLVMLSSSEKQGVAFVETANLDGETNLKIRQCLTETADLLTKEQLVQFAGRIECEKPNNRLYNFDGKLIAQRDASNSMEGPEVLPLGVKQVLLRGCQLRNTEWAYGVAVFTGHETKVMQNAEDPPSKRSNIEVAMNSQIQGIFGMLFFVCIFCAIGSGAWTDLEGRKHWYLGLHEADEVFNPKRPATVGTLSFFTFVILFNTLIPISLYVTIEMVKVVLAFFINQDLTMYHEESDTPAKARTSNLPEELGQIQYIFSDKTGTLTCNRMEFLKCSVWGVSYGAGTTEIQRAAARRRGETLEAESVPLPKDCDPGFVFYDERMLYGNWSEEEHADKCEDFLRALAVCHTVLPEVNEHNPNEIVYQAASPDEGALVFAAKNLGFVFHTRSPKTITVRERGEDVVYEILNVLEFNSTRKRMSVIARREGSDEIVLWCKGADTVIYERLAPGSPIGEQTLEQLEDFADQGLRTLCIAKAVLDNAAYEAWNKTFVEASVSLEDRDAKLDACAEEIEKNLELIGATAIEDKLQDGVPDAIAQLARAGIQIWVLTGDKQETAINIGFACSLLTNDMTLIIINAENKDDCASQINRWLRHYQAMGESRGELALIINGQSLGYALEEDLKMYLLELGIMCKAVVCCRVSPKQKADVTRLVKDNLSQVTLAIGDGANDVSMIQAAHIGVGISGQEGMQAVMASDYAIAQFRFLQPLLLVHGRWSYARIANLICYFFYKNIAFTMTQFWFAMYTGWSGQRLYDDWYQSLYNVIFTSLPVLVWGVFEQDASAKASNEYPQLYWSGQKNERFSTRRFLTWVFNGVWQSLFIFFVPVWAFDTTGLRDNGQVVGIWSLGTAVYTCCLFVVTLRIALETSYWTVYTHVAYWGSLASWFIFLCIYNGIEPGEAGELDKQDNVYFLIFYLFTVPAYWLSIFICCFFCLAPSYVYTAWQRNWAPKPFQMVQEIEYINREAAKNYREGPVPEQAKMHYDTPGSDAGKAGDGKMQIVDSQGNVHAYTGYSFSQDAGQFPYPVSSSQA